MPQLLFHVLCSLYETCICCTVWLPGRGESRARAKWMDPFVRLTSGYTLAGGCMLPCFMLWRPAACACRYLSVAKNKRLRVFIVPREHLDEVGRHPSAEKMVGCNALVYWLPIVPQQTHKWSIHMVVLCSSVYMAWHCGGRMRCHLLWG